MEKPLVSVLIPTHNGALFIKRALLSVQEQSYKNLKIIVINDGSTDNTDKILEKLSEEDSRILVRRNEKKSGFVKSLNNGAELIEGKYIARIDDDDIWIDERKIEKQVEFLEKNPDYVLVGSGIVVMKDPIKEVIRYLFPENDEEIRNSLLMYNLFAHSAVLFSANVFQRAGGYDEKFGFFSDIALWLKMGTMGKLYNFQKYFVAYTDKEESGKNYNMRDMEIRRKLLLRIKMKWRYRKKYPHFIKSVLLALGSYFYSFLPYKIALRPFLFKVRIKILGTPYKYKEK